MKKMIQFSKLFKPAAGIAVLLTIFGAAGFFVTGGFNLGVDFQAGLIQEVKFAPTAFKVSRPGMTNARLEYTPGSISVIVTGFGLEGSTHTFPFTVYTTISSLAQAMTSQIEGLHIDVYAHGGISTQYLEFSAQGTPELGNVPFAVHYLEPGSPEISITRVRTALTGFEQGVSVQIMGQPEDRHFMIRVEDREEGGVRPDEVTRFLEAEFGTGEVIVLRSDYVGSRFAKNLTDQVVLLVILTVLVLFIYSSFRFKMQYAFSLVVAVIFDCLVIVAFIVWTRMEFTTSTIAAILTVFGYSTNDTIVVFDRIRETRRMHPDSPYLEVLNRSLTDTLSRTIITTFSTLLAVLSLYIFTTGAMKDFALAVMVGMFTGVFTTTFVASGLCNLWEVKKIKRMKKKQELLYASAKK